MTNKEIAERISAHLKRFEADPAINVETSRGPNTPPGKGLRAFFNARARVAGARVGVTYISYQNSTNLKKVEAEKYLAWLDAGNVGRHYEALQ